jgi:transposase
MMVAARPVGFRKSPDALAARAGKQYGGDHYSGVTYVFRAKLIHRINLVWWDATGQGLMAKKLERGGFKWRSIQDGVMRLTAAQLGALAEGLNWRRGQADGLIAPQLAGWRGFRLLIHRYHASGSGLCRPSSARRFATITAGSWSMTFGSISMLEPARLMPRASSMRRSATRSPVGTASSASSRMDASILTTMPSNGSILPLELNRKNALFAGSDEGGGNWAVIATLIENCKLGGINPHTWLTEVLTKLANCHSVKSVRELMPWTAVG